LLFLFYFSLFILFIHNNQKNMVQFTSAAFPYLTSNDRNFLTDAVRSAPNNLAPAIVTATVLNNVLESRQEDIKEFLSQATNHAHIFDYLEVEDPDMYKDLMGLQALLTDIYSAYKLDAENPLKLLTSVSFEYLGFVDLSEFVEAAKYIGGAFTTEQATNVVSKILRKVYALLVDKYDISTFYTTEYKLSTAEAIYLAAVENYDPVFTKGEDLVTMIEDRLRNHRMPDTEDDDAPTLQDLEEDEELEIIDNTPRSPLEQ
jgi:hypothetical protein